MTKPGAQPCCECPGPGALSREPRAGMAADLASPTRPGWSGLDAACIHAPAASCGGAPIQPGGSCCCAEAKVLGIRPESYRPRLQDLRSDTYAPRHAKPTRTLTRDGRPVAERCAALRCASLWCAGGKCPASPPPPPPIKGDVSPTGKQSGSPFLRLPRRSRSRAPLSRRQERSCCRRGVARCDRATAQVAVENPPSLLSAVEQIRWAAHWQKERGWGVRRDAVGRVSGGSNRCTVRGTWRLSGWPSIQPGRSARVWRQLIFQPSPVMENLLGLAPTGWHL
eukprot:365511-Chlamydomonas_euryale.AAC.6